MTYTYRKDATVPSVYGKFIPKNESVHDYHILQDTTAPEWKSFPTVLPCSIMNRDISTKTKDILWMVSHCTTESQREDYVKKLQSELSTLTIDILGKCGKNGLPKDNIGEESLGSFMFILQMIIILP